ncbi:sugar kinase [Naumannella cuiyingiana]|uniref:2-dehydro-3-deoxygluconokinase n=1 Tax=Naumannella cuiyingiana TaxID=1347891 RepID=A0A7Z0ILQ1_9ACTN|nr:sugar kinase [Naumannella cuiyingiana]NYI71899.1 2-dehydro-3-deoxygluconokinase [Naumannella cuiyingiana]
MTGSHGIARRALPDDPAGADDTRFDVSTFGEGQLRLTVPAGDRLATTNRLRVTAACSEANVAGLLAQLQRRTAWATVVPDGELGDRILREYRAVGVDTSQALRRDGRVALYFLEPNGGAVPARVRYDREHTPFRDLAIDDFDWDVLLDTSVLFVSGITAALTEATAGVVDHAIDLAHRHGVAVALDVNHRDQLWSADRARATITPWLSRIDILFCSRTDANTVLRIPHAGATVAAELQQRFDIETVITTDGTAGVHRASAEGLRSHPVRWVPVRDRPGAGDAFIGGVLHGWLDDDVDAGIGTGLRAAALALTHHGDLTHLSADDLIVARRADIVR